jgi:hypothetical protein
MSESIKDKLDDAGHKIAETATKVGHQVSEKTEKVADWAKEKAHQVGHRVEEVVQKVEHKTGAKLSESTGVTGTVADIKEHMDVFASCGKKVGKVDHVLGDEIKLTKHDSPDGMHHLIPVAWVAKVHDHVHLSKDHKEVESLWQPAWESQNPPDLRSRGHSVPGFFHAIAMAGGSHLDHIRFEIIAPVQPNSKLNSDW